MLHFQHAMAVPLVVSPGYFFSLNRKMLTSVIIAYNISNLKMADDNIMRYIGFLF